MKSVFVFIGLGLMLTMGIGFISHIDHEPHKFLVGELVASVLLAFAYLFAKIMPEV